MNNIFRNVMNAIANSTSTFVEKMYKSEKETSAKGIDGYSFETTITILDKEGNPVMVARSTVSDKPEVSKDFEQQVMQKLSELAKKDDNVEVKAQPKSFVSISEEKQTVKEEAKEEEKTEEKVEARSKPVTPVVETVKEVQEEIPQVKFEAPKAEAVVMPKEEIDESVSVPESNEVEPVAAVPMGSMLNSDLSVKPVEVKSAEQNPAKEEVKPQVENSQSEQNPTAFKADVSGNDTKRQKIEELLKRYSSLD